MVIAHYEEREKTPMEKILQLPLSGQDLASRIKAGLSQLSTKRTRYSSKDDSGWPPSTGDDTRLQELPQGTALEPQEVISRMAVTGKQINSKCRERVEKLWSACPVGMHLQWRTAVETSVAVPPRARGRAGAELSGADACVSRQRTWVRCHELRLPANSDLEGSSAVQLWAAVAPCGRPRFNLEL